MKRNLRIVLIHAIVIMLIAPASFAQEEVKETVKKRIKIVKVDEKGNKVVIDTILSGDIDLDDLDLEEGISIPEIDESKWTVKDGNVFIMKKGDGHKYKFYSDDGNKVIDKEGVIVLESDDGDTFSIIEIDEDRVHSKADHIIMKAGKNSNHSYIVKSYHDGDTDLEWISEGNKLEEGQTQIIIRSNNDVQELTIKGDAVITIKDGNVKMERDTANSEKGDAKVSKKKKELRSKEKK